MMKKNGSMLSLLIVSMICFVVASLCTIGTAAKADANEEGAQASKVTANKTEYTLSDTLTEFDFLAKDNFISRWGNQSATLSYDEDLGTMTAQANQRIDQGSKNGSYHTKFRVYLDSPGANFMDFMLRQNSGETQEVGGKTIDSGNRNGYEIFTSSNSFEFFDVKGGDRTKIADFDFADENEFTTGKAFYDFEIWVLNLQDKSIQFVINVGGANKLTLNTNDKSAPFNENLVYEGGIRFGADDSTLRTIYTEYGTEPKKDDTFDEEGNYLLADTMTEFVFGKEENFRAAWGNQEATVVFSENNTMHCKAYQEINSVVDTGSYHTKFKMTVDSDDTNWVSLMLRQSIRQDVNNGTCGTRNGYGMFTNDGGMQLMKWENGNATLLKWFQFEPDQSKYAGAVKTIGNEYTFEIWMLNLKNGSVQIIIAVNGEVLANENTAKLGDTTPILNGYFRISQPESSYQAYYQGYDEVSATTELKGEPESEYLPTDKVQVNAVSVYGDNVVAINYFADESNFKGLNLRQTGEQSVQLVLPGFTRDYNIKVNKIANAEYVVKEGYKTEYIVGDKFANDIVVTRTVNGESTDIRILPSEVTGFDGETSGIKTLTITIEGAELQVTVKVAAYTIKDGYINEYFKDEAYANDIIVVKTIGDETEEYSIPLSEITGFDTSATGIISLSFTHVIPFTVEIEVAEYTMNEEFKQVYLIGEAYKNDIAVTKKVGETTTEAEVTLVGFDTATSGIKVVTVTVGRFSSAIEIEVAEYVVKEGYKTEYEIGEEFANDIKVVRKVGDSEKEVEGIEVTGFDSSKAGDVTLTITVNGQTYTATVTVKEAAAGGCLGAVNANGTLFLLGVIALGAVLLRRRKA